MKNTASVAKNQKLHRVAACLYRAEHNNVYYAIFKRAGKQIKRSLKTADRQLANRRLDEQRSKVAKLTGGDAANIGLATFNKETGRLQEGLAKIWLDAAGVTMKASSKFRRENALKALVPFFRCTVRSITKSQVEQWAFRRAKQVSARTFNMERETLVLVLNYAVREGLILDNPAVVVPRMKLRHPKITIPTREQFTKLLEVLRKDPRSREAANLCEFMAYSGCRLGEATTTTWGDVNWEKKQFSVTGGEQGTKNLEARTVPLFPPLERLLKELYGARPVGTSLNERVFSIQSAKRSLGSACDRAGLPHFTHHGLRHFFCSNAIEAGIDFKVIAGWLGHKDGGVLVAKTYGHLRDEHSAAMAKRMTFDASSTSN